MTWFGDYPGQFPSRALDAWLTTEPEDRRPSRLEPPEETSEEFARMTPAAQRATRALLRDRDVYRAQTARIAGGGRRR
jgi:hypothetical protein